MNNIGNDQLHSLFISDLHLCASRPAVTDAFLNFLKTEAKQAEELFILGDLFEYWAGDDDLDHSYHQNIILALKALSQNTAIYFIHGNRDFLVGEAFAEATGASILADPTALNLYGHRVLLSHGDALCTDDVEYQAFKKLVRSQDWQTKFMRQPLTQRKAQIEELRKKSEQEKSYKSSMIMDVNAQAVEKMLQDFNYPEIFIHGHTHRPAVHQLNLASKHCSRIVLGDWYEQGSCLRLDDSGFRNLPIQF
jgi:UDP-2,3-diacylglucosamine hydrolase